MKYVEELDRLVREDMELSARLIPQVQVLRARIRGLYKQIREAQMDFDRVTKPDRERREEIRASVLAIWKKAHDAETSLSLPSAMVSRRNYAELKIQDRNALYDALDRADRLDLVGYAFDDKEVLALLREGKLKGLPAGAVQVVDKFNLQVRPRKGGSDAEGPG